MGQDEGAPPEEFDCPSSRTSRFREQPRFGGDRTRDNTETPGIAAAEVVAIFCAGLLTMLFLSRETGRRSDSEFISQVLSARAERPQLSVSEFRVPNERAVVIWIEGADYIPAESSVR